MKERKRAPSARIKAIRDAILKAVAEDAPVSVRGVYYRAVSAGAVEKNETGYNVIQSQVLFMRREGLIEWDDISDNTRSLGRSTTWRDLGRLFGYYARGENFRRDIWRDQGTELIILSEKEAIGGVVRSVTDKWGVTLGTMRGFASGTFIYELGQYISRSPAEMVYLYHLGDHDPSGLVIEKVIRRELPEYTRAGWELKRLAIDLDQAARNGLTTIDVSPTQMKQHMPGYERLYGDQIIEVDAIPAPRLRELIDYTIQSHADLDILAASEEAEKADRARLRALTEEESQ